MIFFSPLEQYKIIYLFSVQIGFIDLSITFYFFILFLIFTLFGLFYAIFFNKVNLIHIVPKHFFYNLEVVISFFYNLIKSIVPKEGLKFFVLFLFIYLFILVSNTIGLIPYSYTITSQLYLTIILSLTIFIGLIVTGLQVNGLNFFSAFLPPNTSFLLSFLIIPIEIISYIFRPISLAVRLFANMMAGHALLKVIVSFSWKLILVGSLLHSVTIGLLLVLFFLEFCVACIQAYVFTMLVILYLNEIFNAH